MSGGIKLSPLRVVIFGMRMAGHSNSEIAYMLAKAGFHVTKRETIGSLVSQMRRAGVPIPPFIHGKLASRPARGAETERSAECHP